MNFKVIFLLALLAFTSFACWPIECEGPEEDPNNSQARPYDFYCLDQATNAADCFACMVARAECGFYMECFGEYASFWWSEDYRYCMVANPY